VRSASRRGLCAPRPVLSAAPRHRPPPVPRPGEQRCLVACCARTADLYGPWPWNTCGRWRVDPRIPRALPVCLAGRADARILPSLVRPEAASAPVPVRVILLPVPAAGGVAPGGIYGHLRHQQRLGHRHRGSGPSPAASVPRWPPAHRRDHGRECPGLSGPEPAQVHDRFRRRGGSAVGRGGSMHYRSVGRAATGSRVAGWAT
jgi:hypothetical protein